MIFGSVGAWRSLVTHLLWEQASPAVALAGITRGSPLSLRPQLGGNRASPAGCVIHFSFEDLGIELGADQSGVGPHTPNTSMRQCERCPKLCLAACALPCFCLRRRITMFARERA